MLLCLLFCLRELFTIKIDQSRWISNNKKLSDRNLQLLIIINRRWNSDMKKTLTNQPPNYHHKHNNQIHRFVNYRRDILHCSHRQFLFLRKWPLLHFFPKFSYGYLSHGLFKIKLLTLNYWTYLEYLIIIIISLLMYSVNICLSLFKTLSCLNIVTAVSINS